MRTDNTAFCWGSGLEGQLGQSDVSSEQYSDRRVPTPVFGITDAIQISAGGTHACARRTSGLSCWGFGQQVGNGSTSRVVIPAMVTTPMAVNNVEAGGDFTIATAAGGAMFSWGFNGRGQCGDNLMTFPASTPVNLTPVPAVVQNATILAAGDQHACAYVASTQVTWCWGDNSSGALAWEIDGGETRTAVPGFVHW